MTNEMNHDERELETVCGDAPAPRLLFVDDEAMFLRLMRVALGKYANVWQMEFTQDPREAVAKMAATPYDVVVSDVNMPGMDGFQLFKKIREMSPDTVVIMITGMPDVEAAVQAIKAGALEYLRKPITIPDLEKAVLAAIEERDRRRQEAPLRTIEMSECRIAGYDIVRKLAEGAMGAVFLVEDQSSSSRYALKVLKNTVKLATDREDAVRRFVREAQTAKLMKHPNIVALHEFGFVPESGLPYMVMEYFDGRRLNELPKGLRGLSYRQKATIVRQIADALSEVHKHIVCHRDIKPANVLINEELNVKLIDFGIAKLAESDLTRAGCTMGTPAYLSPEAITDVQNIRPQADLFGLGVLCYELFFGKRPFSGSSIAQLTRSIVRQTPCDPLQIAPQAPIAIRNLVMRLLEKNPDDRYASATTVVAAIDSYLSP